MTDDGAQILFYVLVLILPVSALAARRLPVGATFRLALVWVAIFGVAFALIALWQAAVGSGTTVGGPFR